MRYGVSHWFDERNRNARRVSATTGLAALLALALFGLGRLPAVRDRIGTPESLGFEGAEQFVRRIRLETLGDVDQAGRATWTIVESDARAGRGASDVPTGAPTHAPASPHRTAAGLRGLGEDEMDLTSRIRALQLDAPVFRSEELVVEHAVNPEYPDEAIDADAEGPVLALMEVDTTGAVVSVRLLGDSPHPALERAVIDAALQYRYRPYVRDGQKQRVYAAYRFVFRLQ